MDIPSVNVFKQSPTGDTQPVASAPVEPNAGRKGIAGWSRRKTGAILRLGNLANVIVVCVLVPLLGVLSLEPIAIVLGAYIAAGALALCVAELGMMCFERMLRRNFGCMFTFLGRSVVLFFMGTMVIAMASGGSNIGLFITGGGTIFNSIFNLLVVAFHPAYGNGDVCRLCQDAYGGPKYKTFDIGSFLTSNPQLISKAMSMAAGVAVGNAKSPGAAMFGQGKDGPSNGGRPDFNANQRGADSAPAEETQEAMPASGSTKAKEKKKGGWFSTGSDKKNKAAADEVTVVNVLHQSSAGSSYSPPVVETGDNPFVSGKPVSASKSDSSYARSDTSADRSSRAARATILSSPNPKAVANPLQAAMSKSPGAFDDNAPNPFQ